MQWMMQRLNRRNTFTFPKAKQNQDDARLPAPRDAALTIARCGAGSRGVVTPLAVAIKRLAGLARALDQLADFRIRELDEARPRIGDALGVPPRPGCAALDWAADGGMPPCPGPSCSRAPTGSAVGHLRPQPTAAGSDPARTPRLSGLPGRPRVLGRPDPTPNPLGIKADGMKVDEVSRTDVGSHCFRIDVCSIASISPLSPPTKNARSST